MRISGCEGPTVDGFEGKNKEGVGKHGLLSFLNCVLESVIGLSEYEMEGEHSQIGK